MNLSSVTVILTCLTALAIGVFPAAANAAPVDFTLIGQPPIFLTDQQEDEGPVDLRLLINGTADLNPEETRLEYEITDFDGNEVENGVATVADSPIDGMALSVITPSTRKPGWYRVGLSLADKGGKRELRNRAIPSSVSNYTSFAILPRTSSENQSYFGVCEHQVTYENALAMQRSGIRWLRIDVSWSGVQSGPDEWDWSRMDEIVSIAGEYGIQLLPIIDYGTGFASDHQPDGERKKPKKEYWERFVYELVNRYKDSVKYWEVWNEPNISGFWLGTREEFAEVQTQAYKQIKRADPEATVLFAGTSGVDLGWIRALYKNGGWNNSDIAAVHPYMQPNPPERGLIPALNGERSMETEFGKPKPLWITEMGYHTLGSSSPVSERSQAAYTARAMVMAAGAGTERFFWYELANGNVDARDNEANFGLLYNDLSPKPSLVAYATLERVMGSGGTASPVPYGDNRIRLYQIRKADGTSAVMAWSIYQTGKLKLTKREPVKYLDTMGGEHAVEVSETGTLEITLTEYPIYLQNLKPEDIAGADDKPTTGQNKENIVPNGNFELGSKSPSGWTWRINNGAKAKFQYVKPAAQDAAAPGGDTGRDTGYVTMSFTGPRQGHVYGYLSRDIKVKPFTTYRLSYRVKAAGVKCAWVGGGPGWSVRIQSPENTDGEWVKVEGTFDTWDETKWPLMVLIEESGDRLDIDDIEIIEENS